MRILSCAIIVLAGAICFGLGDAAETTGYDSKGAGSWMIGIGGVLFAIEYLRELLGKGDR